MTRPRRLFRRSDEYRIADPAEWWRETEERARLARQMSDRGYRLKPTPYEALFTRLIRGLLLLVQGGIIFAAVFLFFFWLAS